MITLPFRRILVFFLSTFLMPSLSQATEARLYFTNKASPLEASLEAFESARDFKRLCMANGERTTVRKYAGWALFLHSGWTLLNSFTVASARVAHRNHMASGVFNLPLDHPQRQWADLTKSVVEQYPKPSEMIRKARPVTLTLATLVALTYLLNDQRYADLNERAQRLLSNLYHRLFQTPVEPPQTLADQYITDSESFLEEFLDLTPDEASPILASSDELRFLTVGFASFLDQIEQDHLGSARAKVCELGRKAFALSALRTLRGQIGTGNAILR